MKLEPVGMKLVCKVDKRVHEVQDLPLIALSKFDSAVCD